MNTWASFRRRYRAVECLDGVEYVPDETSDLSRADLDTIPLEGLIELLRMGCLK